MRPPLSYVPALFPLAGFIAGMSVSEWTWVWPWGAGIAVAFGIALIVASRRLPEWSRSFAMILIFAGIGCVDMICNRLPEASKLSESREWWSAEVLDVMENDRGVHLTLRLDSLDGIEADVLVHTLHGAVDGAVPGDMVRFRCSFEAPRNDGAPGTVDYAALLARRGISATGFSNEMAVTGHRDTWRYMAWRIRTDAASLLMRSSLSDNACAFLVAIILGDDDWLSRDTRDTFSAAGLAHVLALSGLHVGIIIMMLGFMLLPLGLVWDWRVRCGVIIAALWGYALLTGLSPSVTRAALMASMMCGGIILQRPYVSFNGMLVSALVILIVDPWQLWAPGFQLSYLAVGCILLLMPVIMPWLERLPRWIRWLPATAAMSAAAMLATAVLALYYFHIFPVYFLLANIPVALVLPVIMTAGILLMACEAMGFDPVWLCSSIDAMYGTMLSWAECVTALPSATMRGMSLHRFVLPVYYVALSAGIMALWRRTVWWGLAFVICVCATAVTASLTSRLNGEAQWFIPRDAYSTTIVYHSFPDDGKGDGGRNTSMLTTAPGVAAVSLKNEYTERYHTFIERSGADSLAIASCPVVKLRNNDGTTAKLVLVSHDSIVNIVPSEAVGADYALICRGYHGGWREIADSLHPRCILLSADIPKRRHLCMFDSISSADISLSVMSLRGITFVPE